MKNTDKLDAEVNREANEIHYKDAETGVLCIDDLDPDDEDYWE